MPSLSNTIPEKFFEMALASPQQVVIELDEQIWTYGELLTYVTSVAGYLEIEVGQIVYQYVNRSLEMVCGLLGIMCAGGVYCSLNPADPSIRTSLLLDEIQGRLVLVHKSTRDKFSSIGDDRIKMIDLEQILSMTITADVVEKSNPTVFEQMNDHMFYIIP